MSDFPAGGCIRADMSVLGDSQLLEQWARQGANEAFTELVRRHVLLVWGTARRITGDADLARDVAQTVFADLAGKAGVLPASTFLPGWLHRAAVHAARKCVRGNVRRSERELCVLTQPDTTPDPTEAQAAATLQPLLDEALALLPDADRDAVLMRYFGDKSFSEIGAALGASDDTAQKRVTRALEKLRDFFRQRGVTVAAGSVAASLSLAASSPAPAGTAGAITAAVLGGSTAIFSPLVPLVSMKTLIAAFTVATGVLAVVGLKQNQQIRTLTEANGSLSQQLAASTSARGPSLTASSADGPGKLSNGLLTELLQLRGEVARLRRQTPTDPPALVARMQPQIAPPPADLEGATSEQHFRAQVLTRVNAMKNLALASRIYATDHEDKFPTSLEPFLAILGIEAGGNLPGGIPLDDFEFYPQPRPATEIEPQLILFRAKRPLTGPNGQEVHVFGMADGSVQQVTPDRLAQFEVEGTATGPAPQ